MRAADIIVEASASFGIFEKREIADLKTKFDFFSGDHMFFLVLGVFDDRLKMVWSASRVGVSVPVAGLSRCHELSFYFLCLQSLWFF